MFCPTCGKEIPDDSALCPACGAKLAGDDKKRGFKVRIILPVVLVLVLLAASLVMYQVIRAHTGMTQKVASLIPYRKGDKWGFCDSSKNVVIPTVYDEVYPFSEGLARVNVRGKYGFVNTAGSVVVQPVYDLAGDFSENVAWFASNGKYGFLDKQGNIVIEPVYSVANNFEGGLANVMLGNIESLIDKHGKTVIPLAIPAIDWNRGVSEGLVRVETLSKDGYIDTKGIRYWED
jgi:predicted nucleic acid-binding Zn ribbon protein